MDAVNFDYKGKTYSLIVKKVGQEHCLPRKKREQRKRSYHSLHFVLYGFGTLFLNGQKIFLNKGNVFLLYAARNTSIIPT